MSHVMEDFNIKGERYEDLKDLRITNMRGSQGSGGRNDLKITRIFR